MKRLIALFVALALLPVVVLAQVTVRTPVNVFTTPSGQKVVTYATSEIPIAGANIATSAPNLSGWYPAGNYGVARTATGLTVGGNYNSPLPGGRSLAIAANGAVSKADAAKAVGNFLRGVGGAALKTASAVYAAAEVAKALNDLCNELGYSCYKGADGSPKVDKADPAICTVSPCYSYNANAVGFSGTYSSLSSACQAYKSTVSTSNQNSQLGGTLTTVVGPYGTTQCQFVLNDGRTVYPTIVSRVSVPPSSASYIPSSIEDLENKIASDSGWPSSDNVAKVVAQSWSSGGTLPVQTPTVTGPASVQGPSETTSTPAQNGQPATTTTKTTTYNTTYNNNTYNTTTNTTTVVNNGSTITTTTEQKEPEASPTDSINPDLPKLYGRKYPDGLTGVWRDRKAELTASPLLSLIQTMTPTIATNGGCPQFSIPSQVGPLKFGSGSFGPPCYIWDFCKVVVLLGAAFLARALIFGG